MCPDIAHTETNTLIKYFYILQTCFFILQYPENLASPSSPVINPGRPNTTTTGNFKAQLCSQGPSRAHTSLMFNNPLCQSHDTVELSLLKKRKTRAKTAPLFQDDLFHVSGLFMESFIRSANNFFCDFWCRLSQFCKPMCHQFSPNKFKGVKSYNNFSHLISNVINIF